jgi:hypothetical protein
MELDIETYWLTDRQSECDFDFDLTEVVTELVQGQLRVSRKLEEWVQKNFLFRGSRVTEEEIARRLYSKLKC